MPPATAPVASVEGKVKNSASVATSSSSGADNTFHVTVIKGNVVTPRGVVYNGFVEVVGDTITRVAASGAPVPTLAEVRKRYASASESASPTKQTLDVTMTMVSAEFIIPGFVDIHNHGLGGTQEVIGHWSVPEFSQKEMARTGTLSSLASIIFSASHGDLVSRCIKCVEERVGHYYEDCCVLEGIHAEGPVIHDRGGLPASQPNMSLDNFRALCKTMPSMKVMTISPHLEATVDYARLRYLLDIGVRPSLGHDRVASKEEILGALRAAGTSKAKDAVPLHTTHMNNVMSYHHREPSLINFCLCDRFPSAEKYTNATPPTLEIISDMIHVDPIVVQTVLASRKPHDVAIITDCISNYVPGQRLKYDGRDAVVRAEGGAYLCDSNGRASKTLAGSSSNLADQFYSLITVFGLDVATACQVIATTPARIARVDHVGSIEKGKKANLLLLNSELNTISQRMIYGHWTSHGEYRMLRPSVAHL